MSNKQKFATLLALFFSVMFNKFAIAGGWCSVPIARASISVDSDFYSKIKDRSPRPMRRVHSEGTLPHHGIRDKSVKARRDMPIMLESALAWRVTGDKKWLEVSRNYLFSWFSKYKPSFNPIDESELLPMVSTYAVLHKELSTEQRGLISHKLDHWAAGYIERIRKGDRSNWQSRRIAIAVSIAVALDDRDMFSSLRDLFQKQIEENIYPDGATYDFRKRRAVHYAVYDLVPLVRAALAARTMGEDWYFWQAPSGASLDKAVAWVVPYALGAKKHKEFPQAEGFDAARAKAGVKGFSGDFDPKYASDLMWLSSQFKSELTSVASELSDSAPFYLKMCGQ
ncbi:hypothetical protein LMG33810_000558 [Carnimonas sp. LMG 33810]